MSRHSLHTKCRLCRAQGNKLYLKGARCFSSKCPIERKGAVPPGMHGVKRRPRITDYGIQLRSKQKAKKVYGIMETQFRNYYLSAKKLKGILGNNLLTLLERRLDNIFYLSGLSLSRSHARQLISHQHVLVNGKTLNIPSYSVKINDLITLDKTSIKLFKGTLRLDEKNFKVSDWLDVNKKNYSVKMIDLPKEDQLNQEIDVNLIIQYYSR